MSIFISGGTGLVGSQLVADLIERGYDPARIRVLVRPRSNGSFPREHGVRLVSGEVEDFESLRRALIGVQTVFHCAAALDEKRKDTFWRVNFTGTEHMLEAARWAGVKRFIHVSSMGVYGLLQKIPATEEHPKNPIRPYAVAKLAAERKVLEYHQRFGLQTVILRPTAIIGERDRTITRHILKLVRRPLIPVVEGGRAKVPFVHAKDLAEVMIRASESEKAVGQVYNVEGFSAPLREVLEFCIRTVGSRTRIVSIPYPLAFAGALVIDGFYALLRPTRPPLRARKGIQQLTRDMVFDTTKVRADLQFEPRFGLQESLRQALGWQVAHGQ